MGTYVYISQWAIIIDMEEQSRQEITPTPLSAYLRQIMKERHLSVTTLARGTGVSLQTMKTYLGGQRPSLDNCRKIAMFLDVPLAKIISLVHPDVEEKRLRSLLELYLDLPEEQRHLTESLVFTIHKQFGKHKHIGTRAEIDG